MTSTRPLGWIPPALLLLPPFLALSLALSGCAAPIEGMEKDIKPTDLDALKAAGAKAGGLVVWTSSRAGTPHLFTMKTDGSDTKQLTKGDATDWYPRFSPDGTKILFTRSRDAGFAREATANVSEAWDLYTIPSGGGEVTKVVEDGAWGSWAGPDQIIFMRGPKVMRMKVGSDEASKITDTSRYPVFAGATVKQPELSRDGHFLTLTLAGNHRAVGTWNIKKKLWTQLGEGAQISWGPDGASVIWSDDGGKAGARIAREPVVAGVPADDRDPEKLLLVDLHGKRSREGFPRLSNDGKWLVFGAAIGGLEDDLEDYELFLWETGSAPESATRLTFHSANDRWPDIFIAGAHAPGAPEPTGGATENDGGDGDTAPAAKKERTEAEPDEAAPAKAPAASGAEAETGREHASAGEQAQGRGRRQVEKEAARIRRPRGLTARGPRRYLHALLPLVATLGRDPSRLLARDEPARAGAAPLSHAGTRGPVNGGSDSTSARSIVQMSSSSFIGFLRQATAP